MLNSPKIIPSNNLSQPKFCTVLYISISKNLNICICNQIKPENNSIRLHINNYPLKTLKPCLKIITSGFSSIYLSSALDPATESNRPAKQCKHKREIKKKRSTREKWKIDRPNNANTKEKSKRKDPREKNEKIGLRKYTVNAHGHAAD